MRSTDWKLSSNKIAVASLKFGLYNVVYKKKMTIGLNWRITTEKYEALTMNSS